MVSAVAAAPAPTVHGDGAVTPAHRLDGVISSCYATSEPPCLFGDRAQRSFFRPLLFLPMTQSIIRAILTLPDLYIHFGHFNPKIVKGSLLDSQGNPTWVMERVRTMEEKGSDVNLATYLILDAVGHHYAAAVVISNDSDLEEPIRRVRQRFGVAVDILNPTSATSSILKRVASSFTRLTLPDVQVCQLQITIRDRQGTITRPRGW